MMDALRGLLLRLRAIVRRDTAEVVGRANVFIHGGRDGTDAGKPYLTLRAGDRFDLKGRKRVK